MSKLTVFLLMITLFLFFTYPFVSSGVAGNKLELYYEGEFFKKKYDGYDKIPWDLNNPKHRLELKFLAYPAQNMESYINLAVESTSNDKEFYFNQGHIRHLFSNLETFFFYHEDRHWIEDSPLLFLLSTDRVKDDNYGIKATGARFNFWDNNGFSGTLVLSRYNTPYMTINNQYDLNQNAYIFSLRKYLGKNLKFGGLILEHDIFPDHNDLDYFQNNDWTMGSKSYSRVFSLNTELISGNKRVVTEFAKSSTPLEITESTKWGETAFQTEIRGFRFGSFLPFFSFFYFGKDFRSNLSNRFSVHFHEIEYQRFYSKEFDRTGFYSQVSWLMPGYSITFTLKDRIYKTSYLDEKGIFLNEEYWRNWSYIELYVEFLNNLASKFYYEVTDHKFNTWKHFLGEMIIENSLARLKLQYKIKDIGINPTGNVFSFNESGKQRNICGLELRVNLPRDFLFYSRTAFGQRPGKQWMSGFYQISYRGFSNMEVYLEYGEPGHTDNDLVNDGDVADNDSVQLQDQFKIFLKLWF